MKNRSVKVCMGMLLVLSAVSMGACGKEQKQEEKEGAFAEAEMQEAETAPEATGAEENAASGEASSAEELKQENAKLTRRLRKRRT